MPNNVNRPKDDPTFPKELIPAVVVLAALQWSKERAYHNALRLFTDLPGALAAVAFPVVLVVYGMQGAAPWWCVAVWVWSWLLGQVMGEAPGGWVQP